MGEPMEEIVAFFVLFFKLVVDVTVACVKAFIPNGFLPRKDVKGQTVLITGAGSGLGRLLAKEFAALGANLVLWDVNEKGNEETKAMLAKSGVKVNAYTIDLSKKEAINAVADQVKKEVGAVDILINNAGIVTGRKLWECPDDLMEKTMAVNTNACLFTTKNFVPKMLERNSGHVVTVASIAGKVGTAGLVDYCASKHGAVGFHSSLTAEIRFQGKTGVKTTVVCPYYINTGMFQGVTTKSPTLMPILEPEYVVECIMEAILTDREEVQIPRFLYLCSLFFNLLPSESKHALAEYFGAYESMESFVGRKGVKQN